MSKDDKNKLALGAVAILVLLGVWWWVNNGSYQGAGPVTSGTSQLSGAGHIEIQDSTGSTVAEVVAAVPNAGRFNQLLTQSGVSSSLTGKGPYTVFVATDGAFGRLVPGTINNMSAAQLKRTMQYHIVSGRQLDVDALNNGQIQALSRDTLNFSVDASKGAAYVNSGYVISAYRAKNGIVYVINSVLIPPK